MLHTHDPYNAFLDHSDTPVPSAPDGPLAGLTLAVKDIYDIAGQRTGGGNPQKLAEAPVAATTAPSIQRLLDAGARFVGRTQTDELTFSLMGQNAHYPQPVNPAAPLRVTGGSSSGSAAAVAGGLADIAIGSDTGGSIRAPASFCGLIGLRTTHGAISLGGAMPLAPSFDTFGWFAKDIDVYERVAEVMLGPSETAPHPYPLPVKNGERGASTLMTPSPRSSRGEGKGEGQYKPLRLATLDSLLLGDNETAEYARMLSVVAEVLGEPRTAPALSQSIDDLYWCFRRLQAYEAWATHGNWLAAADRGLGPGVKDRFEFGTTITDKAAEEETKRRDAFRDELAGLLGDDGVLVLPTVPGAAPLKDAAFDDLQAYRERALRLLCLSGLSGFPQITIPLGTIDDAPFGISLLGPAGTDRRLVALARTILAASEAR